MNDDENNDLVENKHSRKDSLLLGYDQRAEAVRSTTNQKARRASDEISQMNDKIVIQHPHLQGKKVTDKFNRFPNGPHSRLEISGLKTGWIMVEMFTPIVQFI